MAMTRFTPGTLLLIRKRICRRGLAGGGLAHFDVNVIHAGQRFQNALGFALICCAASGFGEVNCIDTLTAPLAAEISFTSPNETMSREKPGYLTAFSAFWMSCLREHVPSSCQLRARKQVRGPDLRGGVNELALAQIELVSISEHGTTEDYD